MVNKIRQKLINIIIKHLFKGITANDIFKVKNRGVFYKGKKLDKEQVAELADAAKALQDSITWKILQLEVAYQAQKKMFDEGSSDKDLIFGKAMLYNQSVYEKMLSQVRNL